MSDRSDNGERHDTASPAPVPSPPAATDTPSAAFREGASVDSLLAAAVRGGASDDRAGEARAVAAFRAARESGGRTARTRRRDDWRPNARRRVQLSVRTTLAVLLASLTLGGAAFAAIGSAGHGDKGAERESGEYQNRERPARPGGDAPTPPGPADVPRPGPASPDASAPAERGGASRSPDDSRRQAGRRDDGTPSDDSRRQSPRPAEPNRPNEPNGQSEDNGQSEENGQSEDNGQSEENGQSGSAGSKVPDEPGGSQVPGGDRPEPAAGDEAKIEGGAPQNAPQNAPQDAPQSSPQKTPGTK
ncbi:hypothetical protein [Streptomyces sp. FxanaA7]|nr:hypothetical protein [Streptomyces sp. FxanaA7]